MTSEAIILTAVREMDYNYFMADRTMKENPKTQQEDANYWERDFIHGGIEKVAVIVAKYGVEPESVRKTQIPHNLKLTDSAVAKILGGIDIFDTNLNKLDFSTDQGVINGTVIAHAKALALSEATFDTKFQSRLQQFGDDLLDRAGKVISSVGGKKGFAATGTIALIGTACGTSIAPNLPNSAVEVAIPSETEAVPIEITPAVPPTNVAPAEIALNVNSSLPPYIAGDTERSSVPEGSIALTEFENPELIQSLRAKALMPVVSQGVLSYLGKDGKAYMPVIDQITDPATGEVLKPTGPADKGGIVTYNSENGQVTQYSVVSVACSDGFACMQVVSFNPEDPGVTYNIKVDLKTNKIVSFMPAISATKPSNVSFNTPDPSKWQTPLTGEAALGQVEGLMGISYIPGGREKDGTFSFVSGTEVVISTDKEISWQSDFGLVVKKESGQIYVWDGQKTEWIKVEPANIEEVKDGAQIFKAGDRNFVEVDDKEMFITDVKFDKNGSTYVTSQNWHYLIWNGSEWKSTSAETPIHLADDLEIAVDLSTPEKFPTLDFDIINSPFFIEKLIDMDRRGLLPKVSDLAVPLTPEKNITYLYGKEDPLHNRDFEHYPTNILFSIDRGIPTDSEHRPWVHVGYLNTNTPGKPDRALFTVVKWKNFDGTSGFLGYYLHISKKSGLQDRIKGLEEELSENKVPVGRYFVKTTSADGCTWYYNKFWSDTSFCSWYYANPKIVLATEIYEGWQNTGILSNEIKSESGELNYLLPISPYTYYTK